MSDKQANFRLSEEAHTLLESRARELGISKTDVIELLLRENTKSTKEQIHAQAMRRHSALANFERAITPHPITTLRQAWQAGFGQGWIQYQIRHKEKP